MFAPTVPGSSPSAAADEPTDEWVRTSRDSVMDAETFEDLAALEQEQPVEGSPTDGAFASAVALGDGFTVFTPPSYRSYGDYNIHLITSPDRS